MACSTVLPTSTRVRVGLCALGALALSAHGAFAAEGAKTGPSEVIFLVQLVALMLVGRLLGGAHEPHRPAVGHGHVAGRHRAGPLGAGSGLARFAARHVSERARTEGHARWRRAVRHSPAAAADWDGD